MFTFLVTGGAGFIGSHLTAALLDRGHRVKVLDDLSTGRKENLADCQAHERCEFFHGSVQDAETCHAVLNSVDYVLHQAAIPSVPRSIAEPLKTHAANITGTINLLEAVRQRGGQIKRFVFASSSATYGEKAPGQAKVEHMVPDPLSPYAVQKLAGEYYLKVYAAVHKVPTVALRYFNVFGPQQDPNSLYAAVIPRFVRAALLHESPIVYGDGTQSRDFCYIDNVVEANLLACEQDQAIGGAFNIACGEAITLLQVIELLGQGLGRTIQAKFEPFRSGDIRHSLADIAAAKRALGYRPTVRFATGLYRTVNWYATALGLKERIAESLL